MVEITRRVEIDAGHRLLRHGGKCATLHGHRYAFEATVSGEVDRVGVVLDFADLRAELERVVLGWDHAVVLERGDPLVAVLEAAGQRVVVLGRAPSAESMAAIVADALAEALAPRGVRVVGVRAYETPTCSAYATPQIDLARGEP